MEHIYLFLPHQSSFCISTNSEELIEKIYQFYGCYANNKEYIKTNDHIIIHKTKEDYILETQNIQLSTKHPLLNIDRYIFQHSLFDEQVYPLHGAAVECNGKCYLLLATTGGGKTTLTAYLVSHGLGYLSDDCVLLDKQQFLVYPYTLPMHIREGGMKVLQKNGIILGDTKKLVEHPFFERYIYTPPNYINKPLPLHGVYFLERNETYNDVVDIKEMDCINRLLTSPCTPDIVNDEFFKFVFELTKFKCKRLLYSDMEFVKNTIKGIN